MNNQLHFSPANSKLKKLYKVPSLKPWLPSLGRSRRKIYSLDYVAGRTCPGAKDCLAYVAIKNGKRKLMHGKDQEFTCYAAANEAQYGRTLELHTMNWEMLKDKPLIERVEIMDRSLPSDTGILRFCSSGDQWDSTQMAACVELAKLNPSKLFYGYTKSLEYLAEHWETIKKMENLTFVASRGGRFDHMIDEYGFRESVVVFSKYRARQLGLKIDSNDSLAAQKKHHKFALLIHGTQQAGTKSAKAWQRIKAAKAAKKGNALEGAK